MRRRAVLGVACAAVALRVLWPADAPATIEEQRARLPPPATDCPDPVTGEWLAIAWVDHLHEWYRDTLHVKRDGQLLTGSMDVEGFTGDPAHLDPPPCTPGELHFIVHEPASGTFVDGKVDFRATSWSLSGSPCVHRRLSYVLDEFVGPLDAERQEFVSVNSYDFGAVHYEDPAVFRRVACSDAPKPVVKPPPEPPSGGAMGCGCRPRKR